MDPGMTGMDAAYPARIRRILGELGIPEDYGAQRQLALQPEETDLQTARVLPDGRHLRLSRSVLPAWQQMVAAAAHEGVLLLLISGFRDVDHQRSIIEGKRTRGIPLDEILRVNAAPGYSEHHTGRAVDIGTPGCPPLTEAFEETQAFQWLSRHAARFGFRLSYPRGHPHGFIYEPWHWMAATPAVRPE
jgi:zinc D-Ala-D-Ala carboxypeptidase